MTHPITEQNDPFPELRGEVAGPRRDITAAEAKAEAARIHGAGRPHVADYGHEGAGYLVVCPEGCNLGTSAHQPDEAGALRRVHLHKIATTR